MIDYVRMLREFHAKYEHHTQDKPDNPPAVVVALRTKLIDEEFREYRAAAQEGNLIGVADAIADLLYVVFGAALAYGIPIDEVFTEVHKSNMTKSMLKDQVAIKGKTMKGPNYQAPDIGSIINKYRG